MLQNKYKIIFIKTSTTNIEEFIIKNEENNMDRIAIISNIHGNMPALEAVLADMPSTEEYIKELRTAVYRGAKPK